MQIEKKTGAYLSIIEIIILFAAFFLPGYIMQYQGVPAHAFDYPLYHVNLLLTGIPQIALIVYILVLRDPGNIRRFGILPLRITDITFALLLSAGIFAFLLVLSAIISILPENLKLILSSRLVWEFTKPSLLGPAFLSCLVTGYKEELFFRSYLITRLSDSGVKQWQAWVGTSLLFSIGHLYQGIGAIVVSFILGLYFAFWFSKKKSLHIPALSHGLYNFVVLSMQLLPLKNFFLAQGS